MAATVIVADAPWRWSTRFVTLVRRTPLLLAADGGANHLARIGVRPAAVIGDFDSLLPAVRRWVGEERLVLRPDQSKTDLGKAISYAVDERGADRVTILAATGGRLDHTVENLSLLGRWAARVTIEALEEHVRIVPVCNAGRFPSETGQVVSLFPLGRCNNVRTRGLRWELTGTVLDLKGQTSISNLAEGSEFEVAVDEGPLLVFLHETAGEGAPVRGTV